MKLYKNISKNWFAGIIAVGLSSVMLSSCVKNQTIVPVTPSALITVIQASPDEPAIDFSLDNNRVNLNPLGFGDNIDYFNAYVGKRTAKFVNHTSGAAVLSDTITLVQNVAYSLFLVNKYTQPQVLLLTDSISKPADGKATVRFINLSPDAPAVDLVQGGTVLVANKSFKGSSLFVPVAGNTSTTFEVRQAGTSTVLATIPNFTVNAGFVYTIWFGGLVSSTSSTDKVSANIITNAVYY